MLIEHSEEEHLLTQTQNINYQQYLLTLLFLNNHTTQPQAYFFALKPLAQAFSNITLPSLPHPPISNAPKVSIQNKPLQLLRHLLDS